jgi:hypothetical protein
MLKKSPIFMVLLVTVLVVGISIMYQPTNIESQPQQLKSKGIVRSVTVYASSDGKACLASVDLGRNEAIELLTSDANICDLFGKAKEGKLNLSFEGILVNLSVIPPGFREDFPRDFQTWLYRVDKVQLY